MMDNSAPDPDTGLRTRLAHWRAVIGLALLLALASTLLLPVQHLRSQTNPELTIAASVPALPGATVDVPVHYTNGPVQIAGFVFSIDYDETCLSFLPGEIIRSPGLSNQYTLSSNFDAGDTDGEIDIVIYDMFLPFPPIADGTLFTLRLTSTCSPAPGASHLAPVTFSLNSLPPSFSDPNAAEVAFTLTDGSVLVSTPLIPVTPEAPTFTPISACGEFGSVTLPTTDGVLYTVTEGDGKQGWVTVEAAPDAGYVLEGYPAGGWSFDLRTHYACDVEVTPVQPTVTVINGCGQYGLVAFAETEGVTYSSVPEDATEGEVMVYATAQDGYVLVGDDLGPWSYDLGTHYPCPVPVTPLPPTVTVIDGCGEYGSVALPRVAGVTYAVEPEGAQEGSVVVTATAQDGYVLEGYPAGGWSFDLGTFTACPPGDIPVTPEEPTVTVIDQCGEYGSIELPDTDGVTYFTSVTNPTQGVVTVRAVAKAGYVLQGYDGPWTYDLGAYYACPIPVTPARPTVRAIDGCGEYGAVTLPTTTGVIYAITQGDGKQGSVTIAATAKAGYVLQDYDGPWTYDLGAHHACPIPVTPVEPTVTVIDGCGKYGAVVLAQTTGVTYSAAPPNARQGRVVVSAVAQAGYVLHGYTGSWTYNLGVYTACTAEVPDIWLPIVGNPAD